MMNLDVMLGLSDPALVTRWFVHMPDIDSPFNCIVESVEATFEKVAPVARYARGTSYYYPGAAEVDAITLNIYEYHDFRVSKYLHGLLQKVRKPNGAYGVPKDYKRLIYAHLYHLDKDEAVAKLTFKGAWLTDQAALSLNYESETDRIIRSATFSVDRVDLEFTA